MRLDARSIAPLRFCGITALLAMALALAAPAYAALTIDQLFSNADGTIQFIVLTEPAGQDDLQHLAGQSLTVTSGATTRVFVFPRDLPHADTSRRSVLIATPGYVDAAGDDPQF